MVCTANKHTDGVKNLFIIYIDGDASVTSVQLARTAVFQNHDF